MCINGVSDSVSGEGVEIGVVRLGDDEGDGVVGEVEEDGYRGRVGPEEIAGEREVVDESEGKRVFEFREDEGVEDQGIIFS